MNVLIFVSLRLFISNYSLRFVDILLINPCVIFVQCLYFLQVIFAPRLSGVHVAQLSLSSSLAMAGRPPIMVTLQAVAETAQVEVNLLPVSMFPTNMYFSNCLILFMIVKLNRLSFT